MSVNLIMFLRGFTFFLSCCFLFYVFIYPECLPAMPTTKSCRERCPSWKNATCEWFQKSCFISNQSFLYYILVVCYNICPIHLPFAVQFCFSFLKPLCYLFFSFFNLSSLQVTNGATAQAASYGHEFSQQVSSDWDMRAGTTAVSENIMLFIQRIT